ncbi:hypothetical protein V6N11_055732 [Hibiscus sabdariffa]|uniref:Cytochrome P450 n=2 Tax=Hibiscus sabdariffa TaxID=183260 RepID=A0ABR2AC08_9ROSI
MCSRYSYSKYPNILNSEVNSRDTETTFDCQVFNVVVSSPEMAIKIMKTQDILSGGSETSATVVDWAMAEMMRNPRVMAKAQAEGFEIPSKTRVMIYAWAIGRDPNHWPQPEKLDPERFVNSSVDFTGTNFEFIPFGAGRRICPGLLFAVPNVELPLA